jgi:hypothetical protein
MKDSEPMFHRQVFDSDPRVSRSAERPVLLVSLACDDNVSTLATDLLLRIGNTIVHDRFSLARYSAV